MLVDKFIPKLLRRVLNLAKVILRNIPEEIGGNYLRWLFWSKLLKNSHKKFQIGTDVTIVNEQVVEIGEDTIILSGCKIYADNVSGIKIGDRCSLNHNVNVASSLEGKILIGNDVLIAPNVVMRASNHKYQSRSQTIQTQGYAHGNIIIEDDVWIGSNVVITCGVVLGKGAVIGAGSVVTGNVSSYQVWGGVPARFIKER